MPLRVTSRFRLLMFTLVLVSLVTAKPAAATGQVRNNSKTPPQALSWIRLPEMRKASHIEVHGLPWFDDRVGDFGRLPLTAKKDVPVAVWNRSREPSGGRLRFRSDTTRLALRFQGEGRLAQRSTMSDQGSRGLDVYVDGNYWKSVIIGELAEQERLVFTDVSRQQRDITVYLPVGQELKLLAIGTDPMATTGPPAAFTQAKPIVFYGSSVAQGSGVSRPGMTYEAVLARKLNVDFVNLGFGGAGKAEPAVVELVAAIDACCFVFDLGRSYGDQEKTAYRNMLTTVRSKHPQTPLVCVLPIFNPIENHDQKWKARSELTRTNFRQAYEELKLSDRNLFLVGQYDLIKPTEGDGSNEGVHPSDLGYFLMAERLSEIVRPLLP